MIDEIISRKCYKCGFIKSLDDYYKDITQTLGYGRLCIECKKKYQEKRIKDPELRIIRRITRNKSYEKDSLIKILESAKIRAKKQNVPFTIKRKDIIIPEFCPVLGIKLVINKKCAKDDSISLDRLIPSLGYVAGNVFVISWRANKIKHNTSLEQLKLIYAYMKSNTI